MSLEDDLTEEIKKWATKLDDALRTAKTQNDHGDKMLSNIRAYRKDSEHFLERGDLIKSFECLIWAWAILELCKGLGLFRTDSSRDSG
ncbi:hypothetical protein ES706_00578 [subsurface metagenome]|nr:DUF357 domain-containing protein [Hadesarchaea archaeon]